MNVHVPLERNPYDVIIAPGARHGVGAVLEERCAGFDAVVVVTSPIVRAQPWFDFVHELGAKATVVEVPDGEGAKNFRALSSLLETLADLQLSRRDVLVAVGGGAITDMVGFAAAVYLRGIKVVHVPTTLVGQVDAAIGGKTAINLAAGKNLVGAFHQPVAVLCDSATLDTLPDRERRAGLGEVAKCWLLEGGAARELSSMTIDALIGMAVSLKANIVAADELELGQRALLNYGHTLAHALEIMALARDPQLLRHGEAVAMGLGFAARLACAMGRVDESVIRNHDDVVRHFGLSLGVPDSFSTDAIIASMRHDKKAHHDLTFVLAGPKGFDVVSDVSPELVVRVLDDYRMVT